MPKGNSYVRLTQPLIEGKPASWDEAMDFAAHCIGKDDVGSHIESRPHVGPLNGTCPARIHCEKTRAIPHSFKKMVKEDRMRFARVGSPQQDHIRFFDFLIGVRAASSTEYRRQTGDARGVSSPIAAIDVVAAYHDPGELLCNEVHFIRRL